MTVISRRAKIYVSGHHGMVGSAVCRALQRHGFLNLLMASHDDLDLTNQLAVFDFFNANKPEAQIICAAIVGGIVANDTKPGSFIGVNLMIQTNLFEAARRFRCAKTCFLSSGCVYPRDTHQPIRESQLLTGPLEKTNQWYAMAKLAGMKMAQAYRRQFGIDMISVLPSNLYGPGDNFDLEHAHVIPGLMRRMHEAKEAYSAHSSVWGSGNVRREFLHVDDLAEALVLVMRQEDVPDMLNIGSGKDMKISELASLIKETVGFQGELLYDASRPEGVPSKLLDSSLIFNLGWQPRISLAQGLADTYAWYKQDSTSLRRTRQYTM